MEVWRDRGRQLADNCHKEGRSQAFLSSLSYTVAHSELRQKQVVGQISSGCLSLAAKYKETGFFFKSSQFFENQGCARCRHPIVEEWALGKALLQKLLCENSLREPVNEQVTTSKVRIPSLPDQYIPALHFFFMYTMIFSCPFYFVVIHMILLPPTSCLAAHHKDVWTLQNEY